MVNPYWLLSSVIILQIINQASFLDNISTGFFIPLFHDLIIRSPLKLLLRKGLESIESLLYLNNIAFGLKLKHQQ